MKIKYTNNDGVDVTSFVEKGLTKLFKTEVEGRMFATQKRSYSYPIYLWVDGEIVEVARESTNDGFNEHNATRDAEVLVGKLVKKLTIPTVVQQSELLVCKGKCDHGYNDEFGNKLFCSIKKTAN